MRALGAERHLRMPVAAAARRVGAAGLSPSRRLAKAMLL